MIGRRFRLHIAYCSLLTAVCSVVSSCGPSGPAGLKPIAVPDIQTRCPGGRASWKLEVLDRRAERRESEKVTALVADSIRRSFPGCAWDRAPADAPTITIEIHTFSSTFSYDRGGMWDAAAIWTVLARDATGRTLTEFECDSEASRPNYRDSDNEKMILMQVFDEALRRAVAGLAVVPDV